MGAWMFYGSIICEWIIMYCIHNVWHSFAFKARYTCMRCVCVCSSRLADSLWAALWGAGPVGRGLWPHQLFSLGALHLRAGLLPHLLVRLAPRTSALPGDSHLVWSVFKQHLRATASSTLSMAGHQAPGSHARWSAYGQFKQRCYPAPLTPLKSSPFIDSLCNFLRWLCIVILVGSHCFFVCEQIAFLGLTTAERSTLEFHQRKLRQPVSLKQNPYKWVAH